MKKAILLLSLFLLSACAKSSSEKEKPVATLDRKSRSTVTVNGDSPETYYGKLLFRTSGNCADGTVYFHYLTSEDVQLENDPSGKPTHAVMDFFLYKDGTYTSNYEERVVRYLVQNGYGYDVTFRRQLKGWYSVLANGQIKLEGIGTGSALTYNGQSGIMLKPDLNIHRAGLVTERLILKMVMSSGSQELFDSICGN